MLAHALAETLVSFGLALLLLALWLLIHRQGPPRLGRRLLAMYLLGLTVFAALTTELPARVLAVVLATVVGSSAVPVTRVFTVDLAPNAEWFLLTSIGGLVGLALALILARAAQRRPRGTGRWRTVGLPLAAVGVFGLLGVGTWAAAPAPAGSPTRRGHVPVGFAVRPLVTGLGRPTVTRFGPDGHLYVAVHQVMGTTIVAGDDFSGQIIRFDMPVEAGSRQRQVFARGLGLVTGLAFRDDTIYVSHALIAEQRGEIVALRDTDGDGAADERRGLMDDLLAGHYLWHHNQQLAFGPAGRLFVGQGGTSDHGPERAQRGGTILAVNTDGSDPQIVARGFRNPFGLAFTPQGDLLVTDNGPDNYPSVANWTRQGAPVDELNLVIPGGHYGYPDAFGFPPPGSNTRPPIAIWPPHTAPAGLALYTAGQFPGDYRGNAFVALFMPGEVQRVVLHRDARGAILWAESREFASGFLLPTDVTVSPTGELVVTEFGGGRVQAIAYEGGGEQ